MVNRENLGVVGLADRWPTISIPNPVKATFQALTAHLPPEIQICELGQGYHNAGWSYTEVEVRAPTWSRASEEAERISMECSIALQLGET